MIPPPLAAGSAPGQTRPRRRRWVRALGAMLVALVAVVAVVAAGGYWLSTQSALDWLLARAAARSEGRLDVEGATGSLLSTVHIARLRWRGDEVALEASGVALTWTPFDLFSRRFHAQGFAAQHLDVTLSNSNATTTLPASLALPLEVTIAQAGIGRIDWHAKDRNGTVTGLKLGYAGGATQHRISNLEVVTESGTLSGNLGIAASAPFALTGNVVFRGDGEMRDTAIEGSVTGTLELLDLDAKVAMRGARGTGTARLAPFATVPVVAAKVALAEVDLQRFVAALPATRLDVRLDAAPAPDGFAGDIDATNTQPGPIDAARVPVETLHSHFAWTSGAIDLSGLAATLGGGGSVSGSAHYDLARKGAHIDATLRAVDLRRIQSTLVSTRLDGSIAGELDGARQSLRGELAQSDLRLAFEASLANRLLEVSRLRASVGPGEVNARGRVALDAPRAYSVEGTTRRFDPHRLGDFPTGALDASFKLSGELAPWRASGEVVLAPGSELAHLALSGRAHGDIDVHQVRNAELQLKVAGGTISASGNAGHTGDKLNFSLDLPDVAALRPLATLIHGTGTGSASPLPDTLRGALKASGSASIQPEGSGFDIEAHTRNIAWGASFGVASADLRATLPAAAAGTPINARTVSLSAKASALTLPQGVFSSAGIEVSGTLAHHVVDMTLRGESLDAHVALTGGFQGATGPNLAQVPWPWSGSIGIADNRGEYPIALLAPAKLEIAQRRVHVSQARVRIAEGSADIDEFVWDDGRITSRGSFGGVPLGALARVAGHPLTVRSTLTLKGDWSVAASPRLDGTVHIARDAGDVFASSVETTDPARGLGISVFDASARFVADSVSATGTLRSTRGGTVDATLSLGTVAGTPPGRIAASAPLEATLRADLASLRPLQAWLGTLAALDGRAHVDVAARGTLAEPVLTGEASADEVRIDLAQYGVQLKEGTLRAHFAGDRIVLDDLSIHAGDGQFSAKGTIAASPKSGVAPDVTWHAERFRVVNRPDLRLVVGGDGTLRIETGKLVLAGKLRIDEGNIAYEPTTAGQLADDVVVVGAAPRPASSGAGVGDLPLKLDLEVETEFGVTFVGEGLDTRLAGSVHLITLADGRLNAKGTIRAVYGTYTALGQKLTIDRGALIFDGPVDNPALDVVALRKNLAVEAGLQITGTVRVPRVQLVSNPPVPDNEKLSWLVSGQPLDRASHADVALLASASASLLGKGKPVTQTIANSIGLDDISVHQSSVTTATGAAAGQVVSFGKRISDRLSLVYEQGLTIATNALRIEYTLTRTITLRAEAGTVASVGIYYRKTFD